MEDRSSRERPIFYFVLAAWFGLLTGFGELSLLAVKKFFLGHFVRFGPNVVWMTPVADLLLFMIPGLILASVAWRSPNKITLRMAVFLYSFLGFISALLWFSQLHRIAVLLLATGLAVQSSRLVGAHVNAFRLLVRRAVVLTFALVPILAGGVIALQVFAERHASAQLPSPAIGSPNVLLIVLDTVRAQNLSAQGYGRTTTPNLERFAARGVRFDRAFATAPWTLPSHASIFTGRWPHELSANWLKPLDDTHRTLAEEMSARGYATAGFVANNFYCGYETGLSRGFSSYEDYALSPGELVLSSAIARTVVNINLVRRVFRYDEVLAGKNAEALNESFLSWLRRGRTKPFFAFLNYFDAHEIYTPPEPFNSRFGAQRQTINPSIQYELRRNLREDWQEMSAEDVQKELDAYDGAIAYLDHQLGSLFDELEKLGVLGNTLVIVTSDHGEQFGEHRLFVHGNSLYSQLLHVPLLVSMPGRVPQGLVVHEPVSLRSMPATVLDLIAGETGERTPFPGRSLADYWSDKVRPTEEPILSELTGGKFGKEWYPGYRGEMTSLVIGRHHYIRNSDGRVELYDLISDPFEKNDLALSSELIKTNWASHEPLWFHP